MENGEQMIGYQYLHGVNGDVGGFRIKGTIQRSSSGEATVRFTYQWNDIIDPNFQYTTDKEKAFLAELLFDPKDYIIRIAWDDTSTLDRNWNYTSGWLSGDTWIKPTKNFNSQTNAGR